MSWIKTLFINLITLLVIIFFLELAYLFYYQLSPKSHYKPNWIKYAYCPNIYTNKKLIEADGNDLIIIKTDEIGGRIPLEKNIQISNNDIFLVGDSFIQADEITYEETIYGVLNIAHNIKSYGIGYASWNPIQYAKVIKKIGVTKKDYIVFITSNDVNPSYSRSVYGEMNRIRRDKLKEKITSIFKFSYFVYKRYKNALPKSMFKEEDGLIMDHNMFSKDEIHNCKPLKVIDKKIKSKLSYDYLVWSKSIKCWPDKHLIAYEVFANKVLDLINYVNKELDSNIYLVFVAPGWPFPGENTVGRISNEYSFPGNISISQKGLVNEIKKDFGNYFIIDTEEIISIDMSKCKPHCKNKYFFPADGHWTAASHRLMSEKIIEELLLK